jgi:hypothetical protein
MFAAPTRIKALGLAGAAAAALGLFAAQPAIAGHPEEGQPVAMTEGEAKLAKMLEGRVAGEPQRCIRTGISNRMRVIDDTAYVYGSGRTIYVQRTHNPEDIDRDDVLVQRRFSPSRLCKLDMTTTADRAFGMFSGVVFFNDFIPYTRAD